MLSLSAIARKEKNELSTDSAFIVLLDIRLGEETVRICYNTDDVTWNGNLYQAFPFTIGEVTENTDGSDPDVELKILGGMEPSRVSRTDVEGWQIVSEAVSGTWPGCIVSPYLMVQCSDSRHYGLISDRVYRFSAMDMSAEERHMIHGNNERIRLEAICRAVEFFMRVMKQL